MKKTTKIWLIVAASLLLAGLVIFGSVMAMLAWDFSKLSTVKYETNEHEITQSYKNISIDSDTADIVFLPSDGAESVVICHEQQNLKHSVSVKDNTLTIELVDTRRWYEHIGFSFSQTKITVYMPQTEYESLRIKNSTGDVKIPENFTFESMDIAQSTGNVTNYASALNDMKIKTSTGHIRVENVSAAVLDLTVTTGKIVASDIKCTGNVEIRVSTGEAELTDVFCDSLSSTGNTGDLELKNVIVTNALTVVRRTGDVEFEDCDAATIAIKTDTGDVEGTLRSAKVFFAKSDTGKVDVPRTMTGGMCEITTDTGDIEIKISK